MIVLNGPLGKSTYYAVRVEFQVRVSQNIHSFIWIFNALKLSKVSKEKYVQGVDSIMRTDMTYPVSEK